MHFFWSTQPASAPIAEATPSSASSASQQTSALNSSFSPSASRFFLAVLEYPSQVTALAFSSKSIVSPRYTRLACNSFVSPTSAKTGGYPHAKNVGAPTFSLFPLQFRIFPTRRELQRVVAQALLPVRRCVPSANAPIQEWLCHKKEAGPVDSFGAQKARIKDPTGASQRYISEGREEGGSEVISEGLLR